MSDKATKFVWSTKGIEMKTNMKIPTLKQDNGYQ